MGNYIGFGKSGKKVRDCSNFKGQDKGSGQASCSNIDAQKKNRFYSLLSRGEQEISPNVVNDMLQLFSIDPYALLDLGATLYFVTTLIASTFYIFPDILDKPLMLTLIGDPVIAKKVYKNCPIKLPNQITLV